MFAYTRSDTGAGSQKPNSFRRKNRTSLRYDSVSDRREKLTQDESYNIRMAPETIDPKTLVGTRFILHTVGSYAQVNTIRTYVYRSRGVRTRNLRSCTHTSARVSAHVSACVYFTSLSFRVVLQQAISSRPDRLKTSN